MNESANDRMERVIGACATAIGAASFAVLFTPSWLERLASTLLSALPG